MTEINTLDDEIKKYARLLAEADQDLINDHPLLLGTSKLSELRKVSKKAQMQSCPHDPTTDAHSPINPSPNATPARIKVDEYFIDDIVMPEFQPVDMLPLEPTGFLCLPEHGVQKELEDMDFNKRDVMRDILNKIMDQYDEKHAQFTVDELIEDLTEDLDLPRRAVNMTLEEAEQKLKQEMENFQKRQEREVAKKRKEMITPKSKDEVAFAELERALSSGISLKDEVLSEENFWNVFESTVKSSDAQQVAWAQIHQAWRSLLLSDEIKEKLAATYATKDADYMGRVGELWRSVAFAIRARESCLETFQQFLLEQAQPARYWRRGYCPAREAKRREKVRDALREKTKDVTRLLDELTPYLLIELPWANRTYREKMEKDEVEVFFYVEHYLRQKTTTTPTTSE